MTSYFISYSGKDRAWAEWIAWAIEEVGHQVVIQAWDFRPGMNFVLKMQEAADQCDKTIAIWAAAFAQDPGGAHAKLVPVRVADCDPSGLLKATIDNDLVGLDEQNARERLIAGLTPGRAKPTAAPIFPGAASSRYQPAFPPATVGSNSTPSDAYVPKIRRTFTDADRGRFLREAFGAIRNGFRSRLARLEQAHDRVQVNVEDVHASKFTCDVYVDGKSKARCKIWINASTGSGGVIAYYAGDFRIDQDNSYNEVLHVGNDPHELKLEPIGMAMYARVDDLPKDGLTAEQAAEYLWRVFAWKLEV